MSSLIEKFYMFKLKAWKRFIRRKDPFDILPPAYTILRWFLFPGECFYWVSGLSNRWTPMNCVYTVRKSWFDEEFLIISGPNGQYRVYENDGETCLEKFLGQGDER